MLNQNLYPVRGYIRVFTRAKCDGRLKITFHQLGKTVSVHARCTNVGIGGFCARLSHRLEKDQPVTIEFVVHNIPISLEASVRHSSGFDTGFQFVATGDDNRVAIAKFFMESLSQTH